jgi:hypothetical protein
VPVRATPEGRPVALQLRSRWRGVAVVQERWRIDDEWWRNTISRDYLDVVLSDGKPLTLYFDRIDQSWYVHM